MCGYCTHQMVWFEVIKWFVLVSLKNVFYLSHTEVKILYFSQEKKMEKKRNKALGNFRSFYICYFLMISFISYSYYNLWKQKNNDFFQSLLSAFLLLFIKTIFPSIKWKKRYCVYWPRKTLMIFKSAVKVHKLKKITSFKVTLLFTFKQLTGDFSHGLSTSDSSVPRNVRHDRSSW